MSNDSARMPASPRPRGATWGKPDATGRSSGRLNRAERKLLGPPHGEPWVWQTAELLASDAWRGMSLHCRRFIDFLMIEHCTNAGRENGRLIATYDQLGLLGIHKRNRRRAIDEAVARGLVRITEVGGLHGVDAKRTPSRYRLTWIGTCDPPAIASNEWKGYAMQKHFPAPHFGTQSAPHVGGPTQEAPKEIRHIEKPCRPPTVAGASISWELGAALDAEALTQRNAAKDAYAAKYGRWQARASEPESYPLGPRPLLQDRSPCYKAAIASECR